MMSREVSPFYMNAHCELCSRTHDDAAFMTTLHTDSSIRADFINENQYFP